MTTQRSRRDFLRTLGIGAAATPFLGNLPGLAFANQERRKQRLVIMFSPNGVVPNTFWPDADGNLADMTLKESLSPLEPFKSRMLTLHGVCDRVRGDGDAHMRGMGCLLTGVELFPGNVQGGSDTPAGWARGISIDQEIKNFLQRDPATRTRFGSLEFGVMVPNRADTWTRMVYAGANRPIAPIDDPYQMFNRLYGRMRDQETVGSVLDDLRGDLQRLSSAISAEDRRLLEEHTTFVREMEQDLRANRAESSTPCRSSKPNVRTGKQQHSADRADADRPDGQQLRQRFRARRHAAVHQLRRQGAHELARHHRRPSRTVARARQRPHRSGTAHQHQPLVLRATRLSRPASGRNARTGRRRLAARQHRSSSGPTNSAKATRTRSTTSRSSSSATASTSAWAARSATAACRTTACCLSLAHGFGHRIPRFGNPNFCGDGVLSNLT